jgi:hypothetical protein
MSCMSFRPTKEVGVHRKILVSIRKGTKFFSFNAPGFSNLNIYRMTKINNIFPLDISTLHLNKLNFPFTVTSIGGCKDYRERCPEYAAYPGYCQYTRQFMILNCPWSCDFCGKLLVCCCEYVELYLKC